MTRLVRLHLISRHVPAAGAIVLACAVALRIALHWPWNTYGARQLPLMFEAACAVAIVATTASPFGEAERVTGRWLPRLRLGVAVALTIVAAGALAAAGTSGPHVAVYALYTQWHGPAVTTPWFWPARPPYDIGAAICAGLVFLAGIAAVAIRGARDPFGDREAGRW